MAGENANAGSALHCSRAATVRLRRRHLLSLAAAALVLPAAGCDRKTRFHETDISGGLPRLAFSMTDAMTGAPVTAADFRGKVTLVYFGYTLCPDFCPTTLTNLAAALRLLGKQADQVRILFVTVDPNRDSLPLLKRYVALFAPEIVGLRGTPDELAALARRYRVAYSVTPAQDGHPYQVTHSAIVYVFDQDGNARLLVSSMATQKPDIDGTAQDLRTLIAQHQPPGLLEKIERIV
jgi:protein SCO1/2